MSNKENLLSFLLLIKNPEIRHFTEDMLGVMPSVFWTARASKGHHPEDERGIEGNIVHSERVVKIVRVMAEGTRISPDELDCLTSAALLHDGCRHGLYGTENTTVNNHPSLIRELASNHGINCAYAVEIFALIERHMGKWGTPEYWPEITPSAMLHMADMISAHAEQIWPIGGDLKPSWTGSTPFQEIGINEEEMQLLEELAEDIDYWKSACSFVKSLRNRKFSSLTDKQRNWLDSIKSSLEDELDKQSDIGPDDIPF